MTDVVLALQFSVISQPTSVSPDGLYWRGKKCEMDGLAYRISDFQSHLSQVLDSLYASFSLSQKHSPHE